MSLPLSEGSNRKALNHCRTKVEVGGSNPPGPTNFLRHCFYSLLFFKNRAFWRVSVRGRYRRKVVISLLSAL